MITDQLETEASTRRAPATSYAPARQPAADAGSSSGNVAGRGAAIPVVVAVLILVGVVFRLWVYFGNPSAWLDEQSLTINIATRGYGELTRALDFAQSAPLLFLWIERLAVQAAGVSELSLRFVPLVAGVLLMPLTWRMTRRLFSVREATLAVAVVALSPVLVRYSNEIKPYALDALITLILTWMSLDWLERMERGEASRAAVVRLIIAGSVSVWLSTPAAFVLAAIGVSVLLSPAVRRDRRHLGTLVMCGAIWAVSFVAAYVMFYRAAATNGYMQRYWAGSYVTPSVSGVRAAVDLVGGMVSATFLHRDMFTGPLAPARMAYVALFFAFCGIGAWRAWRQLGATRLALLAAPFVVALAAAVAHKYPLSVRLMLFAVPAFVIVAAAGAAWVLSFLGDRPALVVPAVAIVLAPSLVHAGVEIGKGNRGEQARAVVQQLQTTRTDSSPTYLLSSSLPAWLLYTTDWTNPDRDRLAWTTKMAVQPGGPISDNAPARNRPVVNEGDDYHRVYQGRVELYALPSGMEETATFTGTAPDSGWAANEARRIAVQAKPCVWIVAIHYKERELPDLVAALAQRGFRSETVEKGPGTSLVRTCPARQG